MNEKVKAIHSQLRRQIDSAREGLTRAEEKDVLEELAADIEGWLDCIREEEESEE